MFEVQDISDAKFAFGGDVKNLIPKWEDIPSEFKQWDGTKWNKIFSDWFYNGAREIQTVPKKGVDANKALRHIGAVMRSFEPKHEHKAAAVAYLMSEWFESITYNKGGR